MISLLFPSTPRFPSDTIENSERNQHPRLKRDYVRDNHIDPQHVATLGNGNNDRLLLQMVKGRGLAIAVDNGEGCAVDAMLNADVFVVRIVNALDLLLDPTRCKATLRC